MSIHQVIVTQMNENKIRRGIDRPTFNLSKNLISCPSPMALMMHIEVRKFWSSTENTVLRTNEVKFVPLAKGRLPEIVAI